MTYGELYQIGLLLLTASQVPDSSLDARLLLEHVCGTTRNDFLVHGDRLVTGEQENAYREAIAKRCERIPLQQIVGIQCFYGLDFYVNEHVLIPRSDTECLVEEILKQVTGPAKVLDMCTGSGCIVISLLNQCPQWTGVGVDVSAQALEVARENQNRLARDRQLVFVESNLFENVQGEFDVIVSNPPYIETAVIDTLMPEVKDHEPMLALDGKEDGLFFYRRIVKASTCYLRKGGKLFFEIGYNQGQSVAQLLEENQFHDVCVRKDYAGNDRVVFGTFHGALRAE